MPWEPCSNNRNGVEKLFPVELADGTWGNMKRDEITAAVLAGGQSRRFGYPKTDAIFHGRPLIDIAVQLAKHLSPRVLLMDNGMVARTIEGVESVKDFIQGCGPLGAVYTAMECSQTPWVAIVPCDMPLLDICIYHELVKQSTRLVPIAALGPTGVEPLVSLWPKSLAVRIGERLNSDSS